MSRPETTSPRIASLALGVLFLVAGLVALVGSWGAYFTDTAIVSEGSQAQARMTRKTFIFDAGGDSEYRIEYVFALPDGQRVDGQYGISREQWEPLQEGATIRVRYAAADPARNFPVGYGVTSRALIVLVSLLGLLGVAVGMFFLYAFFTHDKERS
jgi:hypothetical protein